MGWPKPPTPEITVKKIHVSPHFQNTPGADGNSLADPANPLTRDIVVLTPMEITPRRHAPDHLKGQGSRTGTDFPLIRLPAAIRPWPWRFTTLQQKRQATKTKKRSRRHSASGG
jgi:hypothetical protein